MRFQYGNHSVAYVSLHSIENKLNICSGLRQHAIMCNNIKKTKQHSSEKVQNLHSTMFNLSAKHHLLLLASLNSFHFKKTIHHSHR